MEMRAAFRIRGFRRAVLSLLWVGFIGTSWTCAAASPTDTPKQPLRIHVARGLWWQMLHLYRAIGLIGGADLASSVDVYGNPQGYHGCARALENFPRDPAELAEYQLIILAGSRVVALPAETQAALAKWVKAGGGLLITGGPLCLDCDNYSKSPVAEILPVTLNPSRDLVPVTGDNVLRPAGEDEFDGVDWSSSPRVYWYHKGVIPRKESRVLLNAGTTPLLVIGDAGKGKVAVFSGTVCGGPAKDETPFWDWSGWPQVMGTVLKQLTPTSAIAVPAATVVNEEKTKEARNRIAKIGDAGLDGMLDDLSEEGKPTGPAKTGNATGKELVELAKLTRTSDYANAVALAAAGSNVRLDLTEAEAIFNSIARHIAPDTAAQAGMELMKSASPGTAALGLRLAGIGRKKGVGPTMVKFVANGLGALGTNDSGMAGGNLSVPDGRDEGLRLAAAQGLADLRDPEMLPGLKKALTQWKQKRSQVSLLADRQRDVEEMIMGSLAVMGDPDAAIRILDCLMQNSLAAEFSTNLAEHALRNPSPEDLKKKKEAQENLVRLNNRNQRIREILRHLPLSVWPGLASKAGEWNGEFATEALLLVLAKRDSAPLSPDAVNALKMIRDQTPIPAVRDLCRVRLLGK